MTASGDTAARPATPSGAGSSNASWVQPPSSGQGPSPMRPARQPTGSGPVGVVGPVLAVLLLAAGAVLVRDALVAAGALSGRSWLGAAAEGVRGSAPATWLVPAGAVVVLVGLWLVVTALRPRTRTAVPLTSQSGAFLHTRDVARLAAGAARDVDGVLDASASASRRKVVVTVSGTAADGLREDVTAAVTHRLAALESAPRISVGVRTSEETS